jgi:hypothetical protein
MIKNRMTLSTQKSVVRSQPFLVRLFLAIIAFKRMIANRRRWESTKKHKAETSKSSLILEIHKSQRAVKCASFGRSVVDLDAEKIRKFRESEALKRGQELARRRELAEMKKRRRGGLRKYGDLKSMESVNPNAPMDPYILTVADKIRALRSKYTIADFYRRDDSQKKQRHASTARDSSNLKDMTNLVQKNSYISRSQESSTPGLISFELPA